MNGRGVSAEPGAYPDPMTSPWRAIDGTMGFPVIFGATSGSVTTNAPQVASRRGAQSLASATRRVIDLVAEHLHLEAHAQDGGIVTVVVTASDAWFAALPIETDALMDRASAIESPAVRTPSGILTWPELVSETGTEAAVWAMLRSASKTSPFVLGIDTRTLGSRSDDNPLALVRRAHAAASVRLETPRAPHADPAPDCGQARHDDPVSYVDAEYALRAPVLLASRALHDAERQQRARPALLAVEDLAREALVHLERTPVTRTDLPALAAARSILRASSDAVGVSAPVPY